MADSQNTNCILQIPELYSHEPPITLGMMIDVLTREILLSFWGYLFCLIVVVADISAHILEGFGKISGVNFCAALKLPLIFIAPLYPYTTACECINKEEKPKKRGRKSSWKVEPHESNLWIHLPQCNLNKVLILKWKRCIRLPTFIWP